MTDLNSKNHHYQNNKGENDKNNAYNQQKCSLPLSPESDDCVSLKDGKNKQTNKFFFFYSFIENK